MDNFKQPRQVIPKSLVRLCKSSALRFGYWGSEPELPKVSPPSTCSYQHFNKISTGSPMTALDHLKAAALIALDAGASLDEFRKVASTALVDVAIERAQKNQVHAARLIHIHRNTLWKNWGHRIPKRKNKRTAC